MENWTIVDGCGHTQPRSQVQSAVEPPPPRFHERQQKPWKTRHTSDEGLEEEDVSAASKGGAHLWESQRWRSVVAQQGSVGLQRGQVSRRGRLKVPNCRQNIRIMKDDTRRLYFCSFTAKIYQTWSPFVWHWWHKNNRFRAFYQIFCLIWIILVLNAAES